MTTFTLGKEPRLRGNLGAGAPRTVIIVDDGKYTAEGTAEFGFVGRVHAIEAEINVITCDNSASKRCALARSSRANVSSTATSLKSWTS